MANQDRIFSTELNGYKKKQVEEYLREVQANYEKREQDISDRDVQIEKLAFEQNQNKEKIAALEETIARLSDENAGLKEELAIAIQSISDKHKENEELKTKSQNLSDEYQRIARVLVDAEKKAEEVRSEAVAEGEREKARLNAQCDDIRMNIREMVADINDIEATSRESARELFMLFEEQLKEFENNIKAKLDVSSLAMNDFAAAKLAKIETAGDLPAEDFPVEDLPAEDLSTEDDEYVVEEPTEGVCEDALAQDYSFALSDEAKAFFEESNNG